MKKIYITLVSVLLSTFIFAQKDTVKLKKMPAQVSFIYPLGTNGASTQYVNNLSINILAGLNGGLDGVEFGGLYNQNRYNVSGVQFAGLANITGGDTDGFQFSGILNATKNLDGGQIGGTVNIAEDVDGVQIGGIFNAGRYMDGPQISGFMNIAELLDGPQIGGFLNITDSIQGPMISGFMNAATQAKGPQIAGFTNITKDSRGIQIAGFMNAAEKVEGVQIAGFLNICDSIDGIPIAPISIVGHGGYYAFDLSTNESLFLNIAYQMGVREFYSIYQLGIQPSGNRYSLGFGFGVASKLNEKSYLDVQAMVAHVNESYSRPFKYTNLWNQLRLNYELDMHENLRIYAGPSFNILVSKYKNDLGNIIGSDFMPWDINNYDNNNSKVTVWPGFNVGLKIKT